MGSVGSVSSLHCVRAGIPTVISLQHLLFMHFSVQQQVALHLPGITHTRGSARAHPPRNHILPTQGQEKY